MNIDLITVAGKLYGIGNFRRIQNLASDLYKIEHKVNIKVLTDDPSIFKNIDFVDAYDHRYKSSDDILEILSNDIDCIVLDLFGEWAKTSYNQIVDIYKLLARRKIRQYCFDDIRYVEKILPIKNINSFIINGPKQLIQNKNINNIIYSGANYHVLDPGLLKFRGKKNASRNKLILVALGGVVSGEIIKNVCIAIKNLQLHYHVIVYVNNSSYIDYPYDKVFGTLGRKFTIKEFSNSYHGDLANAEYFFSGPGTIKFDGFFLMKKVIVLNFFERNNIALNNFNYYESVESIDIDLEVDLECLEVSLKRAFIKLKNVKPTLIENTNVARLIDQDCMSGY